MPSTEACVYLAAVLYAGVYIVENGRFLQHADDCAWAIYALIAVSMNLLNGFTGLFSWGRRASCW